MPLVFQQKHLRLEVPQTKDGMNLKYDANNKVKTKIVIAPFSAKKRLEAVNAKKPPHLQATITVVEGDKVMKTKEAAKK